jgi:hypothetical protein
LRVGILCSQNSRRHNAASGNSGNTLKSHFVSPFPGGLFFSPLPTLRPGHRHNRAHGTNHRSVEWMCRDTAKRLSRPPARRVPSQDLRSMDDDCATRTSGRMPCPASIEARRQGTWRERRRQTGLRITAVAASLPGGRGPSAEPSGDVERSAEGLRVPRCVVPVTVFSGAPSEKSLFALRLFRSAVRLSADCPPGRLL